MKVLKRLVALVLIGNLIALAKIKTLDMSVVVLLNSAFLLFLERQ